MHPETLFNHRDLDCTLTVIRLLQCLIVSQTNTSTKSLRCISVCKIVKYNVIILVTSFSVCNLFCHCNLQFYFILFIIIIINIIINIIIIIITITSETGKQYYNY